jgi:endonuclease YncB( thermonuclease family)
MLRALLVLSALAQAGTFHSGELVLDGEKVAVSWNDGDSFRIESGERRKTRARLMDVNTLESYGPVHRWGSWGRWELYALSLESAKICAAKSWACTSEGKPDRFGRTLVRCPALAKELVRLGHAMVFAVDAPAPPELVLLQRQAQRQGAGMWKNGVPPRIVSGAHSSLEGAGYDRIVDTRTGKAEAVAHQKAYETCEEVCVGEGKGEACLVYVPFKRRYRDPPPCLTNPRVSPKPPQKAPSKAPVP